MFGDPRQHLLELQLPQIRIADLRPGARGGDGRSPAAAQRVRSDGGLGGVVLAPVHKDLPGPQALGHGGRHQRRHALLQLLGHPPGQHHDAVAADRLGQRHVQVQSLAAAGQRKDPQARCRPSDSRTAWATSLSADMVTPSPGSRSNTRRLAGPGRPSAPKRHCGTWTSSAACWAIQASAGGVVDDRVDGGARLVHHGAAVQPGRRGLGQCLLEERRRLDAIGPSLSGGRPAGDVRHHHRPRRSCSSGTRLPWWCRWPGRAPCRGWSA